MHRKNRSARAYRILHKMTLPEFLARCCVFGLCLIGLALGAVHAYEALTLRIKQRGLVASLESHPVSKTPSSEDESVAPTKSLSSPNTSNTAAKSSSQMTPLLPSATRSRGGTPALPIEGQSTASNESRLVHLAPLDASSESSEIKTSQPLSPTNVASNVQPSTGNIEPKNGYERAIVPSFEVQDLSGKMFFDPLQKHRGKVVILDFWASWCGPCLQEMPILENIFEGYDPNKFQLIAINTEEPISVVQKAVEVHQIKAQVALDQHGDAASVFGVEQLPTLILIAQDGTVQRIRIGLQDGLAEALRDEVDCLLSGEQLPIDNEVVSRLYLANLKDSNDAQGPLKANVSPLHNHDAMSDIMLGDNTLFSAGKHLSEAEERFDRFLIGSQRGGNDRTTYLANSETERPSLIFSRRGKKLHGPLMSFHENGKRQTFIQYSYGKRIATLVAWDTSGRPLVMEQYRNGRKHGVRCIFKSCGGACTTAHLWVAEEWNEGQLIATHVELTSDDFIRHQVNESANTVMEPLALAEYTFANQELVEYEERLASEEEKLKEVVSQYYNKLRREFYVQANARLAASVARNFSFASMFASGTGLSSGQMRSQNFFSSPMMRSRNCGSS